MHFLTAADFKNFYGKYLSMSVVRAHAEMWEAYAQGVQPSRAPNHIPLHVVNRAQRTLKNYV